MQGVEKMEKKPQVNSEYWKILQQYEKKRPLGTNCLKAFFVGGAVCVLGQLLQDYFVFCGLEKSIATSAYLVVIIFFTTLFTGIGIYDKLGQWAGAGLAVPITGFANAVSSSCIEHRTEGYVLGVASNSFKLAGAVVVWGSVAAFVIALIKLCLGVL